MRLHKTIYIHLATAFFLMFVFTGISQTEGPDIVELKNGHSHQGTIIEQHPGHFLKLWQQPSDDTLILQYTDIAILRIVPSEEIKETTGELLPIKQFNQNTYSTLFFASVNGGNLHHKGMGLGVVRKFGSRIQAGLGVHHYWGFESYTYTSITVPAEFKYMMQPYFKGRTSLMFSASLGYHMYLGSQTYVDGIPIYITNGVYFNPSIGYRINFSKNTGMIIDLGYQYMGGKKRRQSNDEFLQNNHLSNGSLKLTLFF